MSMASYEWAQRPEIIDLFTLLGLQVSYRWDEDYITYYLWKFPMGEGIQMGYVKGHGDDMKEVRGKLVGLALELAR